MGANISNGITNFISENDSRADFISSSEWVMINEDSHSSDEIDKYNNHNNRLNQSFSRNNSDQSNTPSNLFSINKRIYPKLIRCIEAKLDRDSQGIQNIE